MSKFPKVKIVPVGLRQVMRHFPVALMGAHDLGHLPAFYLSLFSAASPKSLVLPVLGHFPEARNMTAAAAVTLAGLIS